MQKPKIGIRPIIDGRGAERANFEDATMAMAKNAAKFITENLRYPSGEPVECVIEDSTISGSVQAMAAAEKFRKENVVGTLSVTPCWAYGSETIDLDPTTVKAVWGFNGTESPGAVYLAAAMSAHTQKGVPAFSIYGKDVQDKGDTNIPADVQEKILRFARCAVAVGTMRGKSYVNVGGVSMGIMGSYCDDEFFQDYLGVRSEFVDMTEVLRRIEAGIYDKDEYEKAYAWTKANCKEGEDTNPPEHQHTREQKDKEWEFVVKMTMIIRDILKGNPNLEKMGYYEESLGRNAIAGGFQGQRMWSDWQPVGDFAEAFLCSTYDWNGARQPVILATENDTLNGAAMVLGHLVTGGASVFADVRTYWSSESVERVTGWKPEGIAKDGFIHLINSGSAALDGSGEHKDANGKSLMKPWWEVTDKDGKACLDATTWYPARANYFKGGGFSSQFKTAHEMPVTLVRVNLTKGFGPTLQVVEGHTTTLPENVHKTLDQRTDPTWPTTWFVPNLTKDGACTDVYSVMANWGANHGAFVYGHVGSDLLTLASMLRIPVTLHNVCRSQIFRPHAWSAFGTAELESADKDACKVYGPLYKS